MRLRRGRFAGAATAGLVAALAVGAVPLPAGAIPVDPTPTVEIGTPIPVQGGQQHIPVTVSGFDEVASLSVVLRIPPSSGTLSISPPDLDLQLAYGYDDFDEEERIGFSGPAADVIETLSEDLRWDAPTGRPVVQLSVDVTAHRAGTYFNPDNNHYYELGSTTASFQQAFDASVNSSLFGMTGYLATITSAEENTFIAQHVDASQVWIGATDSAVEGSWRWVAGPEAGTQFSAGNAAVPGQYASWAPQQPDGGATQNGATTNYEGQGLWDDDNLTAARWYLIEYGGVPNQASGAAHASDVERISYYVPLAPTTVSARPSDGAASVSWTAPTEDGGEPITGYTATASPGGGSCTAVAPATTCALAGLANGDSYTVTVTATNAIGSSEPSASSNTVVPRLSPGVDIDQSAMQAGGAQRHVPVTVSNFASASSLLAILEVPSGGGSVLLTDTEGLALAFGYSSFSGRKIGFTGTRAAVTSALGEHVRWVPPADRPEVQLTVTVGEHTADTFFNPANGHYYRAGGNGTTAVAFAAAMAAAEDPANTLYDMQGYLATITSADENAFVADYVNGPNVWIGASDAATEGAWRWVSGPPEEQVQFWQGAVDGSPVDGRYNAWAVGAEPNNFGEEDYAVTNWEGVLGKWNDLPGSHSEATGYLIEYGGMPGDASTALTATTTERVSYYAPLAPTDATATAGTNSAVVSWTAPDDDGGSEITSYTATASPGGQTCTATTATTCTVTGLSAGVPHTFTVKATNAVGDSEASTASTPVTPTSPPPPPPVRTIPVEPGSGPDASFEGGRATFEFTGPEGADPSLTVEVAHPSPSELDRRGITAVGDRFSVTAHDLTFDAVEVCVEVPAAVAALGDRPGHRLRLLHLTDDGEEHDITTRLDLDASPPVVCGVADSFSAFEAVVFAGDRIAGTDRYDTAARVAESLHPDGAPVVYVASGEAHPDAVVAGAAAAHEDAPLLLTARDEVPAPTLAALSELDPSEVVVVGGASAVSDDVLDALAEATGATVSRLAGPDRYSTAAAVARATFPEGATQVYLATGESFPDALAAGASAHASGGAVLLTSRDALPTATAAALATLDPAHIVVVGGEAAVGRAVADAAANHADDVDRVGGADRDETAALLADGFESGGDVVVATGRTFADALVATTVAARRSAPILLTAPDAVPASTREAMVEGEPARMVVIGGSSAVGAAVELVLIRLLPEFELDRL